MLIKARVLQSASYAAHELGKGSLIQRKTKDKKAQKGALGRCGGETPEAGPGAAHTQRGKMPRRGPSEADLYLLYGFASALVFLMGIIIVMRSRGRRMYDVEARGVALDWDGLKHLYRTGTYDVREREAWDSPAARATLTGIPPLKRASKQKRERQERKERRRRLAARRGDSFARRLALEAGVDDVRGGRRSRVDVEERAAGRRRPGTRRAPRVGTGRSMAGARPDRGRDPCSDAPRRGGPGDVQAAPGFRGGVHDGVADPSASSSTEAAADYAHRIVWMPPRCRPRFKPALCRVAWRVGPVFWVVPRAGRPAAKSVFNERRPPPPLLRPLAPRDTLGDGQRCPLH